MKLRLALNSVEACVAEARLHKEKDIIIYCGKCADNLQLLLEYVRLRLDALELEEKDETSD